MMKIRRHHNNNNYNMNGDDHMWWLLLLLAALVVGVSAYMYFFWDTDEMQLKCVISDVDGNRYCVRDQAKVHEAADVLARVTDKCKALVAHLEATTTSSSSHPGDKRVKRLVANFNPQKIMETLPTSEHTAYSENKGEKIAFCLHVDNDETSPLIDEDTLTFVALHELAHVATESVGHTPEFWENFKFLLTSAREAGIHNPVDYKRRPQKYCGMQIQDNPYFDM